MPNTLLWLPDRQKWLPRWKISSFNRMEWVIIMLTIPAFGILIPYFTHLVKSSAHLEILLHYTVFILTAFVIWGGNRYLFFKTREKFSWILNPVDKIWHLLFTHTLFTLPFSVLALTLWFSLWGTLDIWKILLASIVITFFVIIIRQVYEMAYLVQLLRLEKQLVMTLRQGLDQAAIPQAIPMKTDPLRDFIIASQGQDQRIIRMEEIAFLYVEDKIVYLVHKNAQKLLVDASLSEVEKSLTGHPFFRAGRRHLVNLNALHSFKSLPQGKISLRLKIEDAEEIILSKEASAEFRKWISA